MAGTLPQETQVELNVRSVEGEVVKRGRSSSSGDAEPEFSQYRGSGRIGRDR